MDEQFRLSLRRTFIAMNTWMIERSSKRTASPPIKAFYSKLSMLGISECNYDHAQRVLREFGMKDLGDYHELYLKMDDLFITLRP